MFDFFFFLLKIKRKKLNSANSLSHFSTCSFWVRVCKTFIQTERIRFVDQNTEGEGGKSLDRIKLDNLFTASTASPKDEEIKITY